MAKQISLFTTTTICTLLIVLICCHEIAQVDGRHLKSGHCKKCSRLHREINTMSASKVGDHNHSAGLVRAAETKTSNKVEHVTDDFRPTAPGHSPGVGHSINN
ncbi:precursor of CEP7 [Rosa chinensis]|uniref:precursor of CEP7 n=1 Tax=Rosa chinensis TaxID=74649 RepID=UPI000D08829B|nr:precursor of CEP7 [Rosa chinensis]